MNKYYEENVESNNLFQMSEDMPQKSSDIKSFDLQKLIQPQYYTTKKTKVTVTKHVYIERAN